MDGLAMILSCKVNTTYCWFPWKLSPVTVLLHDSVYNTNHSMVNFCVLVVSCFTLLDRPKWSHRQYLSSTRKFLGIRRWCGITTCDCKRTDRCMHKRRRTTRELANNNRALKPKALDCNSNLAGSSTCSNWCGGSIELDILAQTTDQLYIHDFQNCLL